MPVGLAPLNGAEVNQSVGTVLRQFAENRSLVHQHQAWLAATDLKVDPYNLTADDETLIKSAVSVLDGDLQAVDMTFISRLIGLPLP